MFHKTRVCLRMKSLEREGGPLLGREGEDSEKGGEREVKDPVPHFVY